MHPFSPTRVAKALLTHGRCPPSSPGACPAMPAGSPERCTGISVLTLSCTCPKNLNLQLSPQTPSVPQPQGLHGSLGAAAPSNPSSHDICNMSPLPTTLCFPSLQGGEAPWETQDAFWPKPTVRPGGIAMCCGDISHHSGKDKNWC